MTIFSYHNKGLFIGKSATIKQPYIRLSWINDGVSKVKSKWWGNIIGIWWSEKI